MSIWVFGRVTFLYSARPIAEISLSSSLQEFTTCLFLNFMGFLVTCCMELRIAFLMYPSIVFNKNLGCYFG